MLKNLSRLEHAVGDKIYHFVCDIDSPLASVKEALFQFQAYIAQVEANIKAQQDAQAKELAEMHPIVEESKPE